MTAIKKQIKRWTKGFTLVELLVVVAILGILAAILILAINPAEANRKTRDSQRLNDLATIRNAIDLSFAEGYVTTLGAATTSTSAGGRNGSNTPTANYINLDVSNYLSVLPVDPSQTVATTSTDACAVPPAAQTSTNRGVGAMVYTYESLVSAGTYELTAFLESTANCGRLVDGGNEPTKYEVGTAPGLTLLP